MTCRIVTLGAVDHGKSTLLGRLLHDAGALPEGKLEELRAVSQRRGLPLELAFAIDALAAERDQLITIDAAHVHARLRGRPVVFVDAPGHEELLRNAATGAAGADAALLVLDAAEGAAEQTRRHAAMLPLLGVATAILAVNKMDLVAFDEARFRALEAEWRARLARLGVRVAAAIPCSAREGDGVVRRSERTPWHEGPTVLDAILSLEPGPGAAALPLRFPVQDVLLHEGKRVLTGRLLSGRVRAGDEVLFSPGNEVARVRSIERWPAAGPEEARAGESVGLVLDRPLFVERGALASHRDRAPVETDVLDARVLWLDARPLALEEPLALRVATAERPARVTAIAGVLDPCSLEERPAALVRRGEIATVRIALRAPIALDDARSLEGTGRLVLARGGVIAGAGLASLAAIEDQRPRLSGVASARVSWERGRVSPAERERRHGHAGRVVWITGLPASGKSTVASLLERALFDRGREVYRLDGDNLRQGLARDLGFSEEDRVENVRRAGEVALLFADAGLVVIVALISPRRADRDAVRARLPEGAFVEVHADCPVETCAARDPKGLYRAAREGKLRGLTGVDAPYEPPLRPEVRLPTGEESPEESVAKVLHLLA